MQVAAENKITGEKKCTNLSPKLWYYEINLPVKKKRAQMVTDSKNVEKINTVRTSMIVLLPGVGS